MVDGDALALNDHALIRELMHVRDDGRTIEGRDGYHDDLAMALTLGLWNMRTIPAAKVRRPDPNRKSRVIRAPALAVQRGKV